VPEISQDFIEENKLVQTGPKSGGPYSKKDREARRNEVFRLHIELGYSGRKIADLMKVNRKTINDDIRVCYSKITKENSADFYKQATRQFYRFEIQRTRLIEELNKAANLTEKLAIERTISEIDSKVLNFLVKIRYTEDTQIKRVVERLNSFAENKKLDLRYIRTQDIAQLSKKNAKKIWEIMKNDPQREITYM
jgi:predicted DNA-binding protein YlxM (UPF0122 family)